MKKPPNPERGSLLFFGWILGGVQAEVHPKPRLSASSVRDPHRSAGRSGQRCFVPGANRRTRPAAGFSLNCRLPEAAGYGCKPGPVFESDKQASKTPMAASKDSGNIYIGVGGWTFAPWRGVFYPEKLTQAKELEYAASKLTSIEINGTYYGSQKPESFRKWAREVPDGFVFSVKGPRFATNRRVLAEAGGSIKHFYNTGVLELGDRLGPVLWQFAPTKKFDEADFGKFLELLPPKLEGRELRHVVEVRHASFCVPEFIALLRKFETPVVFAEHGTYPAIADVTGDFVYARLQKGNDEIKTCYPPKQLDAWARRLQLRADGGEPDDLPRVDTAGTKKM